MDEAHAETDQLLEGVEKELAAYYEKVAANLNAQQKEALQGYYRDLAKKQADLESGNISQEEYEVWLRRQAASPNVRSVSQKLASTASEANQRAVEIINGSLAGIYILNLAYVARKAEKQYQKSGLTVSSRFIFYDSPAEIAAAYRKAAEQRGIEKKCQQAFLNRIKDQEWNEQKFQAVIGYGMQHGKSNQDMARMVVEVSGMNYKTAIRNVRTCVTATENKARLDYALEMEAKGYKMEKVWHATHDHRTRDTHKKQDLENQPLLERFCNGSSCIRQGRRLMYLLGIEGRTDIGVSRWQSKCRTIIQLRF